MDLFDHADADNLEGVPLAERMRPRTLDEIAGQEHLTGPGKLLRVAVERDQVPSLIFWGPPGCGKTTLAQVIALATRCRFVSLSAVQVGVKDLREAVEEARNERKYHRRRTILFLDEIHRFNKSQQDALLPHVESGTVTLIGATTENPSFEVNAALLSRARVVTLNPLGEAALQDLVARALAAKPRGLGEFGFTLAPGTLDFIVRQADGDARHALTTLEVAGLEALSHSRREITVEDAEQASQHKALRYDQAGEEHYNIISAFIKSLRGSDPDAAVYYMARMIEAGEDPLFIMRRMMIFASEDIGLADPQAAVVAAACLQSLQFVGMPEGSLPMTEACLYLATAPKSNTVITTYANARAEVKKSGALPVPAKLRNSPTQLMKALGYGRQYKYPHNFEGNFVPEDYLPDALARTRFYEPGKAGYEAQAAQRLEAWQALRKRAGEEPERKK